MDYDAAYNADTERGQGKISSITLMSYEVCTADDHHAIQTGQDENTLVREIEQHEALGASVMKVKVTTALWSR
ncbi:MAG: hypothetical protein PHN90_03525 [Methanothrix sp.]|nr:hypothetical protein [Methanothrix sp.]HNR56818.1 hypothetical protein [Methanothrix sp.]HOI70292.1 hypothetical protein [Methanothrix sp.]